MQKIKYKNYSLSNLLIKSVCMCLLAAFYSCNHNTDEADTNYLNIENSSKIVPNHLFSTSSNDSFFFGDIIDVKVIDNGEIVVLDDQSLSIHLLTNRGLHIIEHPIQGRGPGEIQNLSNRMRISSGNLAAVDDYFMKKISLYRIADNRIEHIEDISLESSIGDFFLSEEGQLVLKKSVMLDEGKPMDQIQRLNLSDQHKTSTALEFPAQKEMRLSANMGELNFMIQTTTKFHAMNRFCSNGNSLYHIRTDSLGFRVYNLDDGNEIFSSIYNQPIKRLTFEEKENEVDRLLDSGKEFWGESEKQRLMSEMPDIKPLVQSVVCDLPNGIWMKLMDVGTEEDKEDEEERWILLSEDGEIKGLFNNNLEGKIISFHKGKIFTSNISNVGEIVLDTYDYKITQ